MLLEFSLGKLACEVPQSTNHWQATASRGGKIPIIWCDMCLYVLVSGSGEVGAHAQDNEQWDRQIDEIEKEKWKKHKRRGGFESTRSFVSNLPSFHYLKMFLLVK